MIDPDAYIYIYIYRERERERERELGSEVVQYKLSIRLILTWSKVHV